MNNRETAKKLLVHYFRSIYKKVGVELDHDCISEIEDIVDAIVDAAVSEAKENNP